MTDVAVALEVDRSTAAKKLARWAREGWLRRVRRGLYIPVPLAAEDPASWSEDPLVLADAVWDPCYLTGWTAANHWGLTEQVFYTTVLKTVRRVRTTDESLLGLNFLLARTSKDLMGWGISTVWRDDRRIRMADPARTVIDSLDNPRLGGGIRQCADILAAYLDDYGWDELVEYGNRLGNHAVLKRLGYLLETAELDHEDLLIECRSRISAGTSLLDPGAPARGSRLSRWALRANVRITPREAS